MTTVNPLSLSGLIRRFWRKAILTWGLALLESLSLVAFPIVIAWAVDDLLNGSWSGMLKLCGLCLALLFVGAARRFYDTRAYGRIYCTLADEVLAEERRKQSALSATSARVSLFKELVEFFEESLPSLLNEFIGLFGTLIIVAVMDSRVFLACLGAACFTLVVYWLSSGRIFRLNQGINDEAEKQVAVLELGDRSAARRHFSLLTRWRIRISDLETLNYSLIWLAMSAIVIYTIIAVGSSGTTTIGQVIAVVMYVFGFVEAILAFPLYYVQTIRLREIAERLARPSTLTLSRK